MNLPLAESLTYHEMDHYPMLGRSHSKRILFDLVSSDNGWLDTEAVPQVNRSLTYQVTTAVKANSFNTTEACSLDALLSQTYHKVNRKAFAKQPNIPKRI